MRQSMRRSRSKKGSCVTTHYVKREFSNNELRDNLQAVLPIANRMPATPERPAHSMQLSMPQRTPSMQRHRTPSMPPSVPQPRTPSMQRTQSTPVPQPLSLMMPTRPSNNLNYYNLMNQQGNTRPLISTTDVMGDANSRRSSVTPEAVRAFHEERPPPPPQVQSVPVEPMKFYYTNPLALMMPKNAKPENVCKNQTRSSKARQLNDRFRQTFYDLLAEKGVREETRPLIVDYFMYCTAENVKKENAQIKKVLRLAPDVDLESLKKAFDTYFTLM